MVRIVSGAGAGAMTHAGHDRPKEAAAPPAMFAPHPKANPGVGAGTGSAQEIPDATIVAGKKAGIAQSKYGAPAGWWTPAGTKAEGYMWRSPKGTEVQGHAPAVFAFKG